MANAFETYMRCATPFFAGRGALPQAIGCTRQISILMTADGVGHPQLFEAKARQSHRLHGGSPGISGG